jgi:hypothetical protein
MSNAAAELLKQFERLPVEAQREFSAAILRRSAHFDCGIPTEAELTTAAQAVFSMLDREEGDDAAPR